jgi:hypothetical protein
MGGIRSRCVLVAFVPGNVRRCAPVAHEHVLVEMRDAAADDGGEDVLGIERVGERSRQP